MKRVGILFRRNRETNDFDKAIIFDNNSYTIINNGIIGLSCEQCGIDLVNRRINESRYNIQTISVCHQVSKLIVLNCDLLNRDGIQYAVDDAIKYMKEPIFI